MKQLIVILAMALMMVSAGCDGNKYDVSGGGVVNQNNGNGTQNVNSNNPTTLPPAASSSSGEG